MSSNFDLFTQSNFNMPIKKRLPLFIIISFIGGLLFVPSIKASDREAGNILWIIMPIATCLAITLFSCFDQI